MINAAGIALIKEFEGCKLKAYRDVAGVWTVGYGATGDTIGPNTEWTLAQAEARLIEDIARFATGVRSACKVDPNDNQMAALTSLAYNIGLGAFRKSTVLRMHNAEKFAEAAAAFGMWNKAGGSVRAGLTRRRAAEAQLYLTPDDPAVQQTTRSAPDPAKDPATAKVNPVTVATGISVAAGAAQQAVANVSGLWDSIAGLGIHPTAVMLVLGAVGIAALGYFVYDHYRRRQEGDR